MNDETPMDKALRLRAERIRELKVPDGSTAVIDPESLESEVPADPVSDIERDQMISAGFDPTHPVHVAQFRRERGG